MPCSTAVTKPKVRRESFDVAKFGFRHVLQRSVDYVAFVLKASRVGCVQMLFECWNDI